MTDNHSPEKFQVARSFGCAASSYDDVAVLQRQTADELLERLELVKLTPQRILDLGAGTGRNLSLLQKLYPQAQLVAVDFAQAMLQHAQKIHQKQQGLKRFWPGRVSPWFIVGDAENLPLADNSIELVYANLAVQWCDLPAVFKEINRVLKPGGLLMFSTLGPDTLQELRLSWATVDEYPHINQFLDMHDVAEAVHKSGMADAVFDVDRHQLVYDETMQMMRDLKLLGARNQLPGRRRGLTGKTAMQRVIKACEQFRQHGVIPATYEVIYGHAWAAEHTQQHEADGTVRISIDQIKRNL